MFSESISKLRWCFRCGSWTPTEKEWTKAAGVLIPEEKERIGRFVYQKDAKSCLSGRLLIKKAAWEICNIPYQKQQMKRTDAGKPYVLNGASLSPIRAFNVSHSGDFAVLAGDFGHTKGNIGVDVMRVEWPSRTTVSEYFHTMRRQFTQSEWQVIQRPKDEWQKMHAFYRFWCLKESYVKAIGVGLGMDLQRLEFHPEGQNAPNMENVLCTTRLFLDGIPQQDWMFEESYIDRHHCVAVAVHLNSQIPHEAERNRFVELTTEELLKDVPEVGSPDLDYWYQYAAKEERPRRQTKPVS